MNFYTCTNFKGHYPVGTAAVVAAPDRGAAAAKLNSDLQLRGLPGDARPEDMIPLIPDNSYPVCRILCDGDY